MLATSRTCSERVEDGGGGEIVGEFLVIDVAGGKKQNKELSKTVFLNVFLEWN